MILVRCILLTLVYRHHATSTLNSDSNPNLLAVYQSYCPYNKLCRHSPLLSNQSIPKEVVPCCLPCYCDAQCQSFSDCCPDAPVSQAHLKKTTCEYQMYRSERVQKIGYHHVANNYNMMTTCPDHYEGPLRERCAGQAHSEGRLGLDDVVVVSDSLRMSRVYRNKHCAMCHGVKDFTRWTLQEMRCIIEPTTISNLALSEIEDFLIDHCELVSVPPPGVAHLATRCAIPVEECTLDTNVSRPELAEECKSSLTPRYPVVTIKSFADPIAIKNIYCSACSRFDPETAPQTLCDASVLGLASGRNNGLFALLDLRTTIREGEDNLNDVLSGHPACTSRELYDPITKQCRVLHCNWFAAVGQGSCIPYGRISPGVMLILSLVMVVNEPTELPDILETKEAEFIENTLIKRIGFEKCPLRISEVYMFREITTDLVTFLKLQLAMEVSDTCTYERVMYHVHRKMANPWIQKIPIGKKFIKTIGKLDFYKVLDTLSLQYDASVFFIRPAYLRPSDTLRRRPVRVAMFSCPFFVVNLTEYNRILSEVRRESSLSRLYGNASLSMLHDGNFSKLSVLHDGFYAINEHKMAVCTETYFALANGIAFRSACIWCLVMLLFVFRLV